MVPDENGIRPAAELAPVISCAQRPRQTPYGAVRSVCLLLGFLLHCCPATLSAISSQANAVPEASDSPPQPVAPPTSTFFRYQRRVTVSKAGQACALLDAAIYPHAAPFLKDLRLYATFGATTDEIPYVLTLSQPQSVDTEYAHVLNLGVHGKDIVFDLSMPARAYTDVVLDLDAHNFIATATVTARSQDDHAATPVGSFSLYDLTAQHLSRSTTLHLQELHAPLLHVVLSLSASHGSPSLRLSPRIVRGADVPPSREAQSLFAIAARPVTMRQNGRKTVAMFDLPERVPIERVSVVVASAFTGNFSRNVDITARSIGAPGPRAENSELVTGTIRRVRLTEGGREIHEQQLSIPAILGANLQHPATVEVVVDNGDAAPLPITAIVLEMRERRLCFDTPSSTAMTLFYGDPGLGAPQYAYALHYAPSRTAGTAILGPEEPVPSYHPRPDLKPVPPRYPHLLWIALLISSCSLALAASRSGSTRR